MTQPNRNDVAAVDAPARVDSASAGHGPASASAPTPAPAPLPAIATASATAPAAWVADEERSHLWAMRAMRCFALTAGRRVSRLLLHPITLYYVLTAGAARRHSRRFLARATGRPAGFADVYRHVHHFAATVLDRVYFLRERFDRFDVHSTGMAAVIERLERGEGAFLVGAHMGSFEALRAVGAEHGRRIAMVMYEDNARLINATLAAIAPKASLHTIALGKLGAMLTLRQWLDGGGMAGLLADRTLPGPAAASARSKTLWLPFLGRPAPFSDGPFRLAAMLRRPVFFMVGLYHGGNRYELRFVPLADFGSLPKGAASAALEAPIREALARYVGLLEALCCEAPLNWFNFFDFWADDVSSDPDPASVVASLPTPRIASDVVPDGRPAAAPGAANADAAARAPASAGADTAAVDHAAPAGDAR